MRKAPDCLGEVEKKKKENGKEHKNGKANADKSYVIKRTCHLMIYFESLKYVLKIVTCLSMDGCHKAAMRGGTTCLRTTDLDKANLKFKVPTSTKLQTPNPVKI